MRRRSLLLLLALLLGAVVLWRFVISPLRIEREAERLSSLLELELLDYEVPRERPPLSRPAEKGDAMDLYLEAMKAFEELEVRVDFHEALDAEAIKDEVIADLERYRTVLDLLSRGTRASRVGHLWPPRESPIGENDARSHAIMMIRLLQVDARVRFEAGDVSGALDRILECLVYGSDCGRPFQLDTSVLELLAGIAEDLPREELDRAIEFITADLAADPPVWEAWRWDYLNVQSACRDALRGEVDREELFEHLMWQESRFFGLYEGLASDAEVLAGWKRVRKCGLKLRVAAQSGDVQRLATTQAEIERVLAAEPDEGAAHNALGQFYWGGEVGLGWYLTERQNEMALLLALLMVREKHRTGSFPDDLESIRPEVVPKNPQGGTWRLATDPETGRPAIYLTNADRWEISEVGEPNVEQPLMRLR